jgi:hypothetical protein
MTDSGHDRAGAALLAVLLGLVALALIATTTVTLAWISRRSGAGSLDTVMGEAALEDGLNATGGPVPTTPGESLEGGLTGPLPRGWVGRRRVTRLSSGLVVVQVSVDRPVPGGGLLAHSEGAALWQVGDSGRPVAAPGGWASGP